MQATQIISDEGVSGGVSYKDRNLGKEILPELKEGDILIVSEISRLGRSMSDINKLVNDELKPRKARLVVVQMGIDLDCAHIKALDEMILYSFGFAAQLEKELIQSRTQSAIDVRKHKLDEDGSFISKKGHVCTKLGREYGCDTSIASNVSAKIRNEKAKSNAENIRVWNYFASYIKKNGAITRNTDFSSITDEMVSYGFHTSTGLDLTPIRARAMYSNLSKLYNQK